MFRHMDVSTCPSARCRRFNGEVLQIAILVGVVPSYLCPAAPCEYSSSFAFFSARLLERPCMFDMSVGGVCVGCEQQRGATKEGRASARQVSSLPPRARSNTKTTCAAPKHTSKRKRKINEKQQNGLEKSIRTSFFDLWRRFRSVQSQTVRN